MSSKQIQIEPTFQTFNPKEYLATYYQKIGHENNALMKFYAEIARRLPQESTLLEFSGGPTLYSLISVAAQVQEIHFSDFLPQNLNEVSLWLKKSPEAFDWKMYVKKALIYEGIVSPNDQDISNRETIMREKITKVIKCDAFSESPLGKGYAQLYDVIDVNFVAESITRSHSEWEKIMKNILGLLKPNGFLTMTAIKGANYYSVGDKLFPAVIIDEDDISAFLLKSGFKEENIYIQTIKAEQIEETKNDFVGYTGMAFVFAHRA